MTLARLILREIQHRALGFLLGVLAVAVALYAFIATLSLLGKFDQQTNVDLANLNAETEKLLKTHEDDIRKAMKGLGFNIHIYPEGQDLAQIYAKGYGDETMPERYVEKLAQSRIVTVNHLLPQLTRMVEWPERSRTVLLFGVRGEEPIAHRGPNQKKALIDPVPEGKIVLGHELHSTLKLSVGDTVPFLGRDLEIAKLHDQRGGIDDITAWVALHTAQEILESPGRINSILALECNCASLDRLGEVEREIKAILPDTQIIEVESKALARAVARNKAKALREKEAEQFIHGREQLRATRADFSSLLVLLIAALSLAWIAYLTIVNVRERMVEIGTLNAIGVGGGTLLVAVLARALLIGLVGTLFALVAIALTGQSMFAEASLTPASWIAILAAAPLLAVAAAWIPALVGARRDPATTLRHD